MARARAAALFTVSSYSACACESATMPPQVHKHDVLGPLLVIREQLTLQGRVLCGSGPAPARPRQRAVGDDKSSIALPGDVFSSNTARKGGATQKGGATDAAQDLGAAGD